MLQSMRAAAKYIWWFVAAAFLAVFVFYEQSGLSNRGVTPVTAVAKVNGVTINYLTYQTAVRDRSQQEAQRSGRTLNADQERLLADQVFNEMVAEELLQQEYARRGISVSDDEVRQALLEQPYPPLARSSEFQTEGRFDMQKYQRFLASPLARQRGVIAELESYYRTALARSKLFEQLASDIYLTDAQLWRLWKDTRDSAQVTFVSFGAQTIPDSAVHITDAELAAYFEAHKKEMVRLPGHAVVSVARLPRTITAADSAVARAKVLALRSEIVKGAKFEDVARRESADTLTAAMGGSLGKAPRSKYVPAFAAAAASLKVGEVSQPVLTSYGYHLIKVDARDGDSVTARHILVKIQQGDSTAVLTDRLADALAKHSGAAHPSSFDSAVAKMHLEMGRVSVTEGAPVSLDGHYVPGASSWAFDGAKPGEIGDIIDAEDAYYLVRLDSLDPGQEATLAGVGPDLRKALAREKKLDLLVARAGPFAASATAGTTLEKAAAAQGFVPITSVFFARTSEVPGLDQGSEAIGAAFGLPIGVVSKPVKARSGVVVMRVDKRHLADSVQWDKQRPLQRDQVTQRVREQVIQAFLANLRQNAKIEDNRREIQESARQPTS